MVVQETNEENRMVFKNLTDIFSSAVNLLCEVEVCDGFCLQLPETSLNTDFEHKNVSMLPATFF